MATFAASNNTVTGARRLDREAPFFWDPSILYCDVLIYARQDGNDNPPDPETTIPSEMLSLCRVNNNLWYAAYVVNPNSTAGDQLLRDDARVLWPKAVAQVIQQDTAGYILARADRHYYRIRFRVGTTVFQDLPGGTGAPPAIGNIEDAAKPFVYAASIIRNTVKYSVNPVFPPWESGP